MSIGAIDLDYDEHEFVAEIDALLEAQLIPVPEDPEAPGGPTLLDESVFYDDGQTFQLSAVDALEWELWAGVEQDEAERFLLEERAPSWAFLPPGGELAAALEQVRPQTESPVALIELIKAAARLTAWSESIRLSAMASFYRQRQSQATEVPRPSEVDSRGRPVDPERSWAAEIACSLKIAPETANSHIDTALRLTSTLAATHTALRCGAISLSKAVAISDATRSLDPDKTRAVEAHVLKRAASQSHANLRKSLRTQVAKHDARNQADRHRDARKDRGVRVVPLADGMAGLWIVNTAEKIQQIWVVIQAMATLAKRNTPAPNPPTGTPDGGQPSSDHARPDNCYPEPARTAQPDTAEPGTAKAGTAQPGTAKRQTDESRTPQPSSDPVASRQAGTAGGYNQTTSDEGSSNNQTDRGEAGNSHTDWGHAGGNSRLDNTRPLTGAASNSAPGSGRVSAVQATSSVAGEVGDLVRDERTADQRRADVAADLFEFMLSNGLDWLGRRLPDQHRRRPHIEVLVPISTLLGIDDDPCELTGYGPIPAEMARRIAGEGTWRRILTDPTNGTVLEASTTRHDPGAIVSETLLAAHPVCDWINCNKPARNCDRDHGTPFAQTGITNLADLRNYCELHHVIKDTPAWGWKATNNPDGSTTLTTPTGHRYTTPPPAPGPIPEPPPTAPDPPPF
jgi:hypothetical protein